MTYPQAPLYLTSIACIEQLALLACLLEGVPYSSMHAG